MEFPPNSESIRYMKAVIVYKGKYGATRQYANWLSEKLSLPVFDADHLDSNLLNNYDVVILGSSVYIGKLELRKWITKNAGILEKKRLFLYQVAGSPPEDREKRNTYNRNSLPASIMSRCKFYFLPGRLVKEKLSWWDHFMLKMGARLTKDPKDKKIMLSNYDQVQQGHLIELCHDIRQLLPAHTSSIDLL